MLINRYQFLAFGVAKPYSRLRKDGGALSERSEFAPTPESANRAGNPQAYARANMVFGSVTETKVGPFGTRQAMRPRTLRQNPEES
jgi:hypothetical protein